MDVAPSPASAPRADERPRLAIRVLSLLLVALFVLGHVGEWADAGQVFEDVLVGSLVPVAIALVAMPAIALGLLAIARPTHIGTEIRHLGRFSALMFVVLGAALIASGVRKATVPELAGGMALAAFGGWVFTRSWMLPPPALEPRRRFSAYNILYVFCALFGLVTAGILAQGTPDQKTRAYATALRSDLRNMHDAQKAYRDSLGRYANLHEILATGWQSSRGVYVSLTVDSNAWRAAATHELVATECTMWVGRRPLEARFATAEGEPACRTP